MDQGTGPRAALVTGASRGIGQAIAVSLAGKGYDVAGCFTAWSEEAEKSAAEVQAAGVKAHFAPCDVRDAGAVEKFVAAAEERIGPLSAIVNNAGITRDRPLVLMPPADWEDVLATNLTGAWNVCRAAVFGLIKRKCGVVVNISSVAGIFGNAGQSNYAASKAGIIAMSKSLAREVARYGVRVNVVAPGFIETDMTAELGEKARARAKEMIPLARFGSAADVADLVAFLVSDCARYITGQVLQVDGGISL